MSNPVDVGVTQIIISPSRSLEVFYEVRVDNSTFSGSVGGGKTSVSSKEVDEMAETLASLIENHIRTELGLNSEVVDILEDEEDPL